MLVKLTLLLFLLSRYSLPAWLSDFSAPSNDATAIVEAHSIAVVEQKHYRLGRYDTFLTSHDVATVIPQHRRTVIPQEHDLLHNGLDIFTESDTDTASLNRCQRHFSQTYFSHFCDFSCFTLVRLNSFLYSTVMYSASATGKKACNRTERPAGMSRRNILLFPPHISTFSTRT